MSHRVTDAAIHYAQDVGVGTPTLWCRDPADDPLIVACETSRWATPRATLEIVVAEWRGGRATVTYAVTVRNDDRTWDLERSFACGVVFDPNNPLGDVGAYGLLAEAVDSFKVLRDSTEAETR